MSFLRFDTENEFIEDIKHELGYPVVKVELDETQWRRILKKTQRWFMAKKSLVAVKYGTYSCDQSPIKFSEIDPVNGVYDVLEVLPDSGDAGYSGVDATYFELLPYGYPLWGSAASMFESRPYNQSSYIFQVITSIERRRRLHGSDFDFFVQKDHINGHTLHLTPQRASRQYAIIYKPAVLPIATLEGRDAQLFFEWGVAEAKEILGMIRSKYKDYPAAGGSISTDGPELLEQAKEAKERLTEEIAESQGPMGIVFG